jgi:2-polyprenyl-6-methoxyphenol hydroxylase-like FAD-dependent oxidoreductase
MDWSHAVVVGAGFAGLLAASVLSEEFSQVTIYDRDILPAGPCPRPGVPQSRQAHGLHARGVAALDELLPGFRAEMIAAGGVSGDVQEDIHWYLDGYLAARGTAGLAGIGMTRRSLEWLIRSRVEKLPNVTITGSQPVDGLLVEGGRATGVLARGPGERAVAADLVVDATGRGSRMPAWLAEHGFPPPPQSRLRVDIVYVTRHYRYLPGQLGGIIGTAVVPYPGHLRGAALIRQEGEQWVLTLVGMLGEDPPVDDAGMLAYARSLDGPEIASVMHDSAPLDSPVKMRFPASLRRHYAKLDRIPAGLIVTGDALCSFNPVYAQGMTVAALQALALREALARARAGSGPASAWRAGSGSAGAWRAGGGPAGAVAEHFARAADRLVSAAWAMSVGGDLHLAEPAGRRGPGGRLVNAYLARLRAAASVDPAIAAVYLRVVNMTDPPGKLMTPATMIRVARAGGHARRAACQAKHD